MNALGDDENVESVTDIDSKAEPRAERAKLLITTLMDKNILTEK